MADLQTSDGLSQAPEVVVAGQICLDVIPTLLSGDFEFRPGKLVEAGAAVVATGGAVSNTGLALHRLGVATRLMAKVGDDLFGSAMRQIVESHGSGLADGLVTAPGEATSYSIILSPPGSDRMFIHAPACNATFDESDVDYEAVAGARLFHFGYPPLMEQIYQDGGSALTRTFENVKATGVTTSLDLSMPDMSGPAGRVDWRALLTAVMPTVDLFLPSAEELLVMLRPDEYRHLSAAGSEVDLLDLVSAELLTSLGDECMELGAKVVVIKLGHRGLYLRTAGGAGLASMGRAAPGDLHCWAYRELWAPCFEVDVVGTTGSGDATIAGFLMGVLRGMSPEECVRAACAVGACNVEAADALGGVRCWDETAARVAGGWRRRGLSVDAAGWTWNAAGEVWAGPSDPGAVAPC